MIRLSVLALVLSACSSPGTDLARCVDESSSTEAGLLRPQLLLAEQALVRSGALPSRTRAGYLTLADTIEAGGLSWDGFCRTLYEDRQLCDNLTGPSSFAAYPYCLKRLREGGDVQGEAPLRPRYAIAELSDEEIEDPRFRGFLMASVVAELYHLDYLERAEGSDRALPGGQLREQR